MTNNYREAIKDKNDLYDSVTPCTYEYNRSYLENYSKTQQTAHTHLIHLVTSNTSCSLSLSLSYQHKRILSLSLSLSPSFYQHKRFSLSFALSLSLSFLLSPFHPLFIYSHSSLFFLLPLLLLLLSLSTSLSLHRRVFINTNVSIKMSRPVESSNSFFSFFLCAFRSL